MTYPSALEEVKMSRSSSQNLLHPSPQETTKSGYKRISPHTFSSYYKPSSSASHSYSRRLQSSSSTGNLSTRRPWSSTPATPLMHSPIATPIGMRTPSGARTPSCYPTLRSGYTSAYGSKPGSRSSSRRSSMSKEFINEDPMKDVNPPGKTLNYPI